jgi:hypothetical protein
VDRQRAQQEQRDEAEQDEAEDQQRGHDGKRVMLRGF